MEHCAEPNIAFIPPFDDADADLVIRSSDGTHFRVYKVILAKASGVFKGMLTVPQPDPAANTSADHGLPLVPLTEDGQMLHKLLQLCYPVADPDLASLDEISHLQAICDKYEMDGLMKNLEKPLKAFMDSYPLRVFAIACRAKFADTAREAARKCLSRPLSYVLQTSVAEYKDLSIDTYRALPSYHHRCTRAVSQLTAGSCSTWLKDLAFCFFQCKDCPAVDGVTLLSTPLPRRWWRAYMDSVAQVLADTPDPEVIACVPKPSKLECRNCNGRFSKDLARFLPLLEQEVKRTIDEVRIHLVL